MLLLNLDCVLIRGERRQVSYSSRCYGRPRCCTMRPRAIGAPLSEHTFCDDFDIARGGMLVAVERKWLSCCRRFTDGGIVNNVAGQGNAPFQESLASAV